MSKSRKQSVIENDGDSGVPSEGTQHGGRGWHLGSRINALDMIRFCEQSAILSSELTGLGGNVRHEKIRQLIVPWFVGSLTAAHCNALVLHRDPQDLGSPIKEQEEGPNRIRTNWGDLGIDRYYRRQHPMLAAISEFDLDLVCAPLDGVRSLGDGRTSSACIIAGGERGCFIPDPEPEALLAQRENRGRGPAIRKLPERFFAIVVGRDVGGESEPHIFGPGTHSEGPESPQAAVPSALRNGEPLKAFLERERPTESLLKVIKSRGARPTIGWSSEGAHTWAWPRQEWLRHIELEGSSVCAAISALQRVRGVDIAWMFCRRTHAILIAAAAKALDGHAWFIPVDNEPNICSPEEPRVFGQCDLVPGRNVFLIATGATTGRALHGVEYLDNHRVVTHSLCLATFHGSKRRINNRFDLRRVQFVDHSGQRGRGEEILKRFRQETRIVLSKAQVRTGALDGLLGASDIGRQARASKRATPTSQGRRSSPERGEKA